MIRIIVACCLIGSFVCESKVTIDSVRTSSQALFNQNPYWDEKTNSVYFVDLFGKLLYCYNHSTNEVRWLTVEGIVKPAFFMPIRGSHHLYAVGGNDTAYLINWDGLSRIGIIDQEVFHIKRDSYLNSAWVSSRGDFYVGNNGPDHCAGEPEFEQYGFTADNRLKVFADQYVSTVGAVLVERDRTFYHLDTCRKSISAFDWNPSTGGLSSEREIMVLDQYPDWVVPTGLAADVNGYLYSGLYNGSAVIKIDPFIPAVVDTIELPTPYINSPTFGGPNYDVLFVTSANLPVDFITSETFEPLRTPPAGNLFKIRGLQTKGVRSYRPYF